MKFNNLILLSYTIIVLAIESIIPFKAVAYDISRYIATFELIPNNSGKLEDVAVTLDITYNIGSISKNSGFKFVGMLPIKDISITNESYEPLEYKLESKKEQKISWSFPQVAESNQTVILNFTIIRALKGSLKENHLNFEWVKNWKIPVHNVTYKFILPNDYKIENIKTIPKGKIEQYSDGDAIIVHINKLGGQGFSVKFSPGLGSKKKSLWGSMESFIKVISFSIIGLIAIVFFIRRSKSKNYQDLPNRPPETEKRFGDHSDTVSQLSSNIGTTPSLKTTSSLKCPECGRVVYNRRQSKCGYCGMTLPEEYLMSEVEVKKIEQIKKDLDEEEKKIKKKKKGRSGGDGGCGSGGCGGGGCGGGGCGG